MELLDVTMTGLQRRNRAAFVDRPTGAPELRAGQKVVLREDEGEYFAGTVVDGYTVPGGTRYLVHVGVRLPEDYAMLRLGRQRQVNEEESALQDVLDLIGEARDALRGRVPSQRFAH